MLFLVPIVHQALSKVNSIYDLIYSSINKLHDVDGTVYFFHRERARRRGVKRVA